MGLSKASEALAKLVVCSILGGGVDMCNSNLAVVKLLDDGFTLLADITDADEFCLAVALKEMAANTLDHSAGRASARHVAVLDVPEDAHRRDVFRTAVLWRTILLASLAMIGRWHEHHGIRRGATAITDGNRDRSSVGKRCIGPYLFRV